MFSMQYTVVPIIIFHKTLELMLYLLHNYILHLQSTKVILVYSVVCVHVCVCVCMCVHLCVCVCDVRGEW